MKKIITYSMMLLAAVVLLASCSKRDYYDDNRQEDAYVYEVANEFFTVEFKRDGRFAIIENLGDENTDPRQDETIRGDFGLGTRRLQNISAGFFMNANILENNITTEADAQAALDDYFFHRYGYLPFSVSKPRISLKADRQKISVSK